jgi:hypothetical protein
MGQNYVFKFLSVSNIVVAPANTGIDKTNRNAVMKMDQTNKCILYILCPGFRIFRVVEIKFIAP